MPQIPTPETAGWFVEEQGDNGIALALRLSARGLVHEERTAFQHIQVYETETFGKLMVIDGCVMLTSRDEYLYHEMIAHPALTAHADPRRVVIIGGGDCGTLREVLKHDGVQHAVQVDIDEGVTRAALAHFPELCVRNDDPRAELRFEDGVAWMDAAVAGSVDVIIVDSTDPVGPAEGLFAEPFFRACYQALGDGGVLVQQSESPLMHGDVIRRMRASMREAGFAETRTLGFPQPVYPTGWWSCTMARKGRAFGEPREIELATRYYRRELHATALEDLD